MTAAIPTTPNDVMTPTEIPPDIAVVPCRSSTGGSVVVVVATTVGATVGAMVGGELSRKDGNDLQT